MIDTATTPAHDDAPTPHRPTLMTVHAHPDDETIGTGGAMARAVADGHRVVLVTGTRGEQGEIVVPKMDTDENYDSAAQYGIQSIPTLLIFREGREIGRIVGYAPKPQLKRQIERALSVNSTNAA